MGGFSTYFRTNRYYVLGTRQNRESLKNIDIIKGGLIFQEAQDVDRKVSKPNAIEFNKYISE